MVDENNERTSLPYCCMLKLGPIVCLRIATLVTAFMALSQINSFCYNTSSLFGSLNATTTSTDIMNNITNDMNTNNDLCPYYETALLLLRTLLWIHIIDAVTTSFVYIYLFWNATNHAKEYVLDRYIVKQELTTKKKSNNCFWIFCCKCSCTLTSICTCCCLGGHEVFLRGDFTDIANALNDLLNINPNKKKRYSNKGTNDVDNTNNWSIAVTTSDWVAGLLLVAEEQLLKRRQLSKQIYMDQRFSVIQKQRLKTKKHTGFKKYRQSLFQRKKKDVETPTIIEEDEIVLDRPNKIDNDDNNNTSKFPKDFVMEVGEDEDAVAFDLLGNEQQNDDDNMEEEEEENDNISNEQIINVQKSKRNKNVMQSIKLCRANSDDYKHGFLDVEEGTDNAINNDDNMKVENRKKHSAKFYYEVTERQRLSVDDIPLLEEAIDYMSLSMAIYGYVMYLYNNEKDTGCCSSCFCPRTVCTLCSGSTNEVFHDMTSCCETNKKNDDENRKSHDKMNNIIPFDPLVVDGDDCFHCNEVAFLEMGLSGNNDDNNDQHLVYATFRSSIDFCPYCIVLDHKKKAVILVIQGTLSLEAAMADIILQPVNILETLAKQKINISTVGQEENMETRINTVVDASLIGEYCHAGMLQCAINLLNHLREHKKLNQLLIDEDAPYASYKFICTGHSLGAGVASLLSILLEPTLKARGRKQQCFSFSPPGCVLTKKLAKKDYIISFVIDSDIVPRLSLHAMEALRNDVLEMIARAKIPKYQIFSRSLFPKRDDNVHASKNQTVTSKKADSLSDTEKLFHARDKLPATDYAKHLKQYFEYQKEMKADSARELGDTKLVIPGSRIVHIVKDRTMSIEESDARLLYQIRRKRKQRNDYNYTAILANIEDFAEIQVSKSFLNDHMPISVLTNLKNVVETLITKKKSEEA